MPQSASSLRKAIESYLRENDKSPAAEELRSAARALGEPSPGEKAAREAGSGTQDSAPPRDKSGQGEAKPNSPGADMDNPPFPGVKKRETARELARRRFQAGAKR
jgi:hypothetical protein